MKIETARFGEIACAPDAVVVFPEGLPGFDARRFVLMDAPEAPGTVWLQALEDPTLALLTVDPTAFEIPFEPRHKPAETAVIRPGDEAADVLEWRLLAYENEAGDLNINRFAPIVIHRAAGLAMQLFLVGSGYALGLPWPPAAPVE